MKAIICLVVVLLSGSCRFNYAQELHPHILVKPRDKEVILEKIHQQPWAHKILEQMLHEVTPYVERHKKNPEWILSRYLMNRVPGKRYTRFYSDSKGTKLIRYGGDAPYPTIRVSPHKRRPITNNGYSYRLPSIEELVPYDTSTKMYLQSNAPDGKWKWVKPQSFVGAINGEINDLVLKAAIVYWLTEKEPYAVFAADLLSQWARGAFYQKPITGPCRTGFLHIQTLGDRHTVPMILAYDFLYDFLHKKDYDTHYYESVFKKIAATMTFRGYWNNNWFAAQTSPMVFAALSLEDKKLQDYYLNFYLNKDTIHGACGQLALPSAVKKWLTGDGHWKETGGYHNYAVGNLLESALAMERNGYPIFQKFPALFKASYVMLKYAFPNLKNPAFGDNSSRPFQSPTSLEIALLMAKKYQQQELLNQLLAAMNLLVLNNHYERSSSGYMGLLCFLPEIPSGKNLQYDWPRSGELDYAKLYLQRNGTDRLNGLMYVVQGATYNHNHANGMAMELYGAGSVMGADPGSGLTYEAPLHVHYYAQWAAHNTVIAGSRSASVPYFTGSGGAKKIGHINLAGMEPLPDKKAVSPFCSFTDTRYKDMATGSREQRTMSIIRTSDTAGYYVDIYRSGDQKDNEYLYHNIGDTVQLFTMNREPVPTVAADFPMNEEPFDPPGFHSMKNYSVAKEREDGMVALFNLNENTTKETFMQVLFPGEKQRKFYTAMAPITRTASLPYQSMPTPVLICRQEGEAWDRPFVAVYEPYRGKDNYQVSAIKLIDNAQPGIFTALQVRNRDKSRQLIFQSLDSTKIFQKNDWEFQGKFGVINIEDDKLKYLYIGEGSHLSYMGYSLKVDNEAGAASLIVQGNRLQVSCNQSLEIHLPNSGIKKIMIKKGLEGVELPFSKNVNGIAFKVPSIRNAVLQVIE